MRARLVGLVGLLALTCASAFVFNTPRTLSLAQRCSPPLAAARKKPIKKRKPIAKNKTPAEEDPTALVGAVAGAGAVAVVADVVTDGAAISTAAVTADAAATAATTVGAVVVSLVAATPGLYAEHRHGRRRLTACACAPCGSARA